MPQRLALLLTLLCSACAPRTDAQTHVPAAQDGVPVAMAVDPARVQRLQQALAAAETGTLDATLHAQALTDPIGPWIRYADLRRRLATLEAAEAETFLASHGNMPAGGVFRRDWLPELARRERWAELLTQWDASIDTPALTCLPLVAKAALNQRDAAWSSQTLALWRAGKPLPQACGSLVDALGQAGLLTTEQRWARIDAAIATRDIAVIRAAATGFDADTARLANAYADFLQSPNSAPVQGWPHDRRSAAVVSSALVGWAKKDHAAAEAALPALAQAYALDVTQSGLVRYEIALQSGVSYEPDAARRLAAVPEALYDDRLFELRAREAIARSDWAAALAAIGRMPPALRDTPRWRLLAGRLHAARGQMQEARELYRLAAAGTDFHAFLAADAIGAPYTLCPLPWRETAAGKTQAAAHPGLQRALLLRRLGKPGWAVREWNVATEGMSADQRYHAIALARDDGWMDRAVFGLQRDNPAEQRLYALRFPLAHEATIAREAQKHGLDPSWVIAEIRAESIFDPDVRSSAGALGLMQIMPATGQAVATRLGLPYAGERSLRDADTNIVLGTAYLREMQDRWGALPAAIAAYNAGPTPVTRWTTQRPDMDPALWIETISYKETRDYVARVLAFSVYYDWRWHGRATRLTDRMAGKTDGADVRFVCATPAR